jgi:hypothetical protein
MVFLVVVMSCFWFFWCKWRKSSANLILALVASGKSGFQGCYLVRCQSLCKSWNVKG